MIAQIGRFWTRRHWNNEIFITRSKLLNENLWKLLRRLGAPPPEPPRGDPLTSPPGGLRLLPPENFQRALMACLRKVLIKNLQILLLWFRGADMQNFKEIFRKPWKTWWQFISNYHFYGKIFHAEGRLIFVNFFSLIFPKLRWSFGKEGASIPPLLQRRRQDFFFRGGGTPRPLKGYHASPAGGPVGEGPPPTGP